MGGYGVVRRCRQMDGLWGGYGHTRWRTEYELGCVELILFARTGYGLVLLFECLVGGLRHAALIGFVIHRALTLAVLLAVCLFEQLRGRAQFGQMRVAAVGGDEQP